MNCEGNKEGNGNGNEGGRHETGTATKRALIRMVVGNKKGNGDSSKSGGNSNKGGWQATATRVMATRVVGERQ